MDRYDEKAKNLAAAPKEASVPSLTMSTVLCCECQDWRMTKGNEAVTIMGGDALCSWHAKERVRAERRSRGSEK